MPKIDIIGCMDNTKDHTFESANRIYGTGGVAPTIPTCAGGGIQPKVMEIQKMIYKDVPEVFQRFIYEINGELYLIRIRKLTPLECWRLMGFCDSDYEKAASVNSNTQLYKQAGNSIVKQVLMNVFSQMIPTQNKVSALQKKALALLDL